MTGEWITSGMEILITISQVLTAGIAITAFSVLFYTLTFNLRQDVVRIFALIMFCVVIIFSAEAIGSASNQDWLVLFTLRIQWIGIILLPTVYFQFSDAVLATTGKPSQGRRSWLVRISYLVAIGFILALVFDSLVGPLVVDGPPAPHLEATWLTDVFVLYYVMMMVFTGYNFIRAYRRTITPTSRRRMAYLLVGAIAPPLGSFPYLLFSSDFAGRHPGIFWSVAVLTNFILGAMIVVMAYAVAFFDTYWSDRVVKARLFKWIMRGPATASLTLGLVTIVRRAGESVGIPYNAFVPITMVVTILLCEHLISLFGPVIEKNLFWGSDRRELETLHSLEDRLLTRNDLRQFFELVVAVVCDRLQAPGAYLVTLHPEGMELVVRSGKTRFDLQGEGGEGIREDLSHFIQANGFKQGFFRWGDDLLISLKDEENGDDLLGLLGIAEMGMLELDEDQQRDLQALAKRCAMALKDRQMQEQILQTMEALTPQVEFIQQLRASPPIQQREVLMRSPVNEEDAVQWVRDALSHYWGGPRLTENPLLRFKLIQDALEAHDGNPANALRAILRSAIERVRPEGERRFTGEWILYNILELKFIQGKKVREIASRLALSEADLYRKQRVAIEAVTRAILDMEAQAQTGVLSPANSSDSNQNE